MTATVRAALAAQREFSPARLIGKHPADQFEAFRDLIDKGSTPADVARFGISESTVAKRLKLGRVSPPSSWVLTAAAR
jgi:hypothetical protein